MSYLPKLAFYLCIFPFFKTFFKKRVLALVLSSFNNLDSKFCLFIVFLIVLSI